MKRISKLVLLVLVVISMCLLLSCQSGGKKVVKLTSENWQDYLDIKQYNYQIPGDFIMYEDRFKITSKKQDYVFENVDGIINCSYDVIMSNTILQQGNTAGLTFKLDRTGKGFSQFVRDFCKEASIDGETYKVLPGYLKNIRIVKIEFKSGTVRKNELAD